MAGDALPTGQAPAQQTLTRVLPSPLQVTLSPQSNLFESVVMVGPSCTVCRAYAVSIRAEDNLPWADEMVGPVGFFGVRGGCVMNPGDWSAVCGEGGGRGVRRGRVLVQYGYEVEQWVAHISYICSNVGGEF